MVFFWNTALPSRWVHLSKYLSSTPGALKSVCQSCFDKCPRVPVATPGKAAETCITLRIDVPEFCFCSSVLETPAHLFFAALSQGEVLTGFRLSCPPSLLRLPCLIFLFRFSEIVRALHSPKGFLLTFEFVMFSLGQKGVISVSFLFGPVL